VIAKYHIFYHAEILDYYMGNLDEL